MKKVWIGFCDGRMFLEKDDLLRVPYVAVFKTRRAARKVFEDVRPFVLRPVKRGRK